MKEMKKNITIHLPAHLYINNVRSLDTLVYAATAWQYYLQTKKRDSN